MMNIEAEAGEHISDTAKRAISKAKWSGQDITMTHNGIQINVYPLSYLYDILEKYDYKSQIRRLKK